MAINLFAGAGLVALGYLLGQDGKPTGLMIVAPADQNGRPQLPQGQPLGLPLQPAPAPTPGFGIEPILETLANNLTCRDASTKYFVEKFLDARMAAKVLLIVRNSGDQAVTIQVVGSHSNEPRGDTNDIGSTYSLASGDMVGFGIDLSTEWYPYLGVTVLTGGSPLTSGNVQVTAYGQRWVKLGEGNERSA